MTRVRDAHATLVDSATAAPDGVRLRVEIAGRPLLLNLSVNQDLTRQATRFVPDIATGNHRVYSGGIDSNPASWARLTSIDGYWVGAVWDGATLWVFDPASRHATLAAGMPENATVVFAMDDAQMPDGFDEGGVRVPPAMRGVNFSSANATQASSQKYLAITLVLDTEFQTLYGSSAKSQAVAILNVVQGFYVAQVGVDVYLYSLQALASDGTLTSTEPNTLLTAFGDLMSGGSLPFAGDAHLLSGKDFDGSTIGLAYIGSLCSNQYSIAVVQTTFSVGGSGVTMAHELGHNFGAEHDGDGNACPSTGYIMQASVNFSNLPTSFSTCSLSYFSSFLAQDGLSCVSTTPPDRIFANGFD